MRITFNGQEIDIMDDAALVAAIQIRTAPLVARVPEEELRTALARYVGALTFFALKFGAMAWFHGVRRDLPVDVDHLQEVASLLHQSVGLNYAPPAPAANDDEPTIIVPDDAALEGEDLGS